MVMEGCPVTALALMELHACPHLMLIQYQLYSQAPCIRFFVRGLGTRLYITLGNNELDL